MQQVLEPVKTTEQIVIEAIGRTRLLIASYNGTEMQLAPHQLYSRRGEFFVSALNMGKNWRSVEEQRLGHFKIAGLSSVALSEIEFSPLESFDHSLPQEEDEKIFAVVEP